MNGAVIAKVLKNRFEFSEALDREGFATEASVVRHQILYAMGTTTFRTAARIEDNVRYAIRGQLGWEDIARNTVSGAAGGAVAGGMAGAGIVAIPGAVIGGTLGAISQPVGSLLYKTQGATSKAASQSGDLVGAVGRLAGILTKMGAPEIGQQIQQIAQMIQEKIGAVRKQQYDQLSEQYGLSGADEKGMWGHFTENISNPLAYLGRSWQMRQSEIGGDVMTRVAVDQRTVLTDPYYLTNPIAQRASGLFSKIPTGWHVSQAKNIPLIGKVGGGLGTGPLMGGLATSAAVGWGWNKISDAIKGQMGVIQGLATDIVKMAAEMSKQTQDPSYMQYGQQIQQIVTQAVPQLAQRMQQGGTQYIGSGQGQMSQVQNPYVMAANSQTFPQSYPTAGQSPYSGMGGVDQMSGALNSLVAQVQGIEARVVRLGG